MRFRSAVCFARPKRSEIEAAALETGSFAKVAKSRPINLLIGNYGRADNDRRFRGLARAALDKFIRNASRETHDRPSFYHCLTLSRHNASDTSRYKSFSRQSVKLVGNSRFRSTTARLASVRSRHAAKKIIALAKKRSLFVIEMALF